MFTYVFSKYLQNPPNFIEYFYILLNIMYFCNNFIFIDYCITIYIFYIHFFSFNKSSYKMSEEENEAVLKAMSYDRIQKLS